MIGNGSPGEDEKEVAMDSGQNQKTEHFSRTGEPRPSDVPITVITALILLIILFFVAVL